MSGYCPLLSRSTTGDSMVIRAPRVSHPPKPVMVKPGSPEVDPRKFLNRAPSCICTFTCWAQFLNVIESVFSGLARAIIHNSDYGSIDEAKTAIDRYLWERNNYHQGHPKRAGKKIWGQERVLSQFSETQNCEDPMYR